MVKISAAVLGLLLLTSAAQDKPFDSRAQALAQDSAASPAVSIDMRNVRLHVASDAILDVKGLRGWPKLCRAHSDF